MDCSSSSRLQSELESTHHMSLKAGGSSEGETSLGINFTQMFKKKTIDELLSHRAVWSMVSQLKSIHVSTSS